MGNLLVIREQIKNFYAKFEIYITPALKFVLAFTAMLLVKQNVGYYGRFGSVAIILIIALMCAFLPYNFIIFMAAVYTLLHLYRLSFEVAIVAICVFLLLFLLYFRFSPKDTIVVILTPICFMLRIPYVMPLAMGLIGTPASIISVCCGTAVYYLLDFISTNDSAIVLMDADGSLTKFRYVVDGLMNNKTMLAMLLAVAVTITVVYLIRRLSVDHAWTIAIVTGALMNIVLLLLGDLVYDTNISILGTFFGMIVSVGIVLVLKFFVFNVDYSRTESVQFEDDEYYYYVKAVPKNTVTLPEKQIKKINSQTTARETQQTRAGQHTGRTVQQTSRTAQQGTRPVMQTAGPVTRGTRETAPVQNAVRMQTTARTTTGTTRPVTARPTAQGTVGSKEVVRPADNGIVRNPGEK